MIMINPVRRAIDRAREQGRSEAVEHLRAAAQLHRSEVGDARRRGALNAAADDIAAGRAPRRTPVHVEPVPNSLDAA